MTDIPNNRNLTERLEAVLEAFQGWLTVVDETERFDVAQLLQEVDEQLTMIRGKLSTVDGLSSTSIAEWAKEIENEIEQVRQAFTDDEGVLQRIRADVEAIERQLTSNDGGANITTRRLLIDIKACVCALGQKLDRLIEIGSEDEREDCEQPFLESSNSVVRVGLDLGFNLGITHIAVWNPNTLTNGIQIEEVPFSVDPTQPRALVRVFPGAFSFPPVEMYIEADAEEAYLVEPVLFGSVLAYRKVPTGSWLPVEDLPSAFTVTVSSVSNVRRRRRRTSRGGQTPRRNREVNVFFCRRQVSIVPDDDVQPGDCFTFSSRSFDGPLNENGECIQFGSPFRTAFRPGTTASIALGNFNGWTFSLPTLPDSGSIVRMRLYNNDLSSFAGPIISPGPFTLSQDTFGIDIIRNAGDPQFTIQMCAPAPDPD